MITLIRSFVHYLLDILRKSSQLLANEQGMIRPLLMKLVYQFLELEYLPPDQLCLVEPRHKAQFNGKLGDEYSHRGFFF